MHTYFFRISFVSAMLCASTFLSAGEWNSKPYKIPPEQQLKPTETEAALRIGLAPTMPPKAERSGYCCMTADITVDGKAKRINASYCSDRVFGKPSKAAMRHWQFTPAVVGNKPVKAKRQKFHVKYFLVDESGRFLPDPHGKLSADHSVPVTTEELCHADVIS